MSIWADLKVRGRAKAVEGPLLFLERNVEAGLQEAVEVLLEDGAPRVGQITALDDDEMVIEVLETTTGMALEDVSVRFRGQPLQFGVGPGLLGRIFNGRGEPIDGGLPVAASELSKHQRRAAQPGQARAAAGLHRNGRLGHRPAEQPDPGAEAADLLFRRAAA